MATYVTYNNFPDIPIRIQNFIMVENFDDIIGIFENFTGYEPNMFNDDISYIAIKNADENYDTININNKNYQNLKVCGSTWFPSKFSNDNLNGIWKDTPDIDHIIFTIEGELENCSLKKIFSELTRFNEKELRISNHNETFKTLDNTIIFISKENIKNLFSNRRNNNFFRYEDMVERCLKFDTEFVNNTLNICNYFRTFNDIGTIPDDNYNDPLGIRQSLGLDTTQDEISNNNLRFFRQFINGTRNVSFSNFTLLGIINRLYYIMGNKKSKNINNQRNITDNYDFNLKTFFHKLNAAHFR